MVLSITAEAGSLSRFTWRLATDVGVVVEALKVATRQCADSVASLRQSRGSEVGHGEPVALRRPPRFSFYEGTLDARLQLADKLGC
jgi:hypothetical protein